MTLLVPATIAVIHEGNNPPVEDWIVLDCPLPTNTFAMLLPPLGLRTRLFCPVPMNTLPPVAPSTEVSIVLLVPATMADLGLWVRSSAERMEFSRPAPMNDWL